MNKIYSMLGICMKAGKLIAGSDVCKENIKANKVSLIIIAEDISLNTKEKFIKMCIAQNIKYIVFGDMEILSRSIGKINKGIIGILDMGFSEKIIQMVEEVKGASI